MEAFEINHFKTNLMSNYLYNHVSYLHSIVFKIDNCRIDIIIYIFNTINFLAVAGIYFYNLVCNELII
jgi:hypothetical protein